MSWSSGTFSRIHNWTDDSNAGIGIVASRHDEEADNFSDGINACLHKSGQNSPTANISWGGYKVTSLGAGTSAADAARLDQAQLQVASYIADSGAADAYVVTLSPAATAYTAGMMVRFKPSAANTGAATVNVNGLGVKSIKLMNGADPYRNALHASQIAECVYDGTNFVLLTPARPFLGAMITGAAPSLANTTLTALEFTTESYDSDAWHNASSNTDRLTIPAGVSYVRLSGWASFDADGAGSRGLYITKNVGATVVGGVMIATSGATYPTDVQVMTPVLAVSAGDYFVLKARQNSGGALSLSDSYFAIEAVI